MAKKQTKDEILESGVVHFTVGEDMGLLLMQIAQEHLLYNLDPVKAVRAIEDSLIGCPKELVLQILRGDIVLPVDVDTQQVMAGLREEGLDDRFPKLNIPEWYIRQANEIRQSGYGLKKAIDQFLFSGKYHKVRVEYNFGEILRFISGKDDMMLEDLIEKNEEVGQLAMLVDVTRKYIERSLKVKSVIDWMRRTYPQDFVGEERYIPEFENYRDIVLTVMEKFKGLYEIDYSELQKEDKALSNYLENAVEIDNVLKKGITEVNILDNWSAGWLSRDGRFFGMNGEYANNIHLAIADGLREIGIIPKEYNDSLADQWLEQQGWVKIHGNHILFCANMNKKINKPVLHMSAPQIKAIYEYACHCHGSALRLGYPMEVVTAPRFQMMGENPEYLSEKYFEF
jgi:hypothetical protein